MAYKLYLDGVLMPVTPSKVTVKIKNQNQTTTLVNGQEINILKSPGLSEVSFELLLPKMSYPFINGTTQSVSYYLSLLERLKTSKSPFQFILTRQTPNGGSLHHTNLTVSLESYDIIDDAEQGFDTTVKVNLRQYQEYGAKTVTIQAASSADETATASVQETPRSTTSAPSTATYTVKTGDTLWNIAKKYLGDGSRYTEIYELNKDKVTNPNLIHPNQVLTLPT